METCGTLSKPCRSIPRAVQLVAWDGHIYLDGSGTKKQPFDCKNRAAHDQHPGIFINKSVTMERFQSTPYVTCEKGFHFHKMQRKVNIELSGIAFSGTPLTFDDCSQVQLINCSHQNTKKAVIVHTKTIPILHFGIQGSSFFQNSHCVEIWLKNGSGHSLVIHIEQTRFQQNVVDGKLSAKPLISIATDGKTHSRSTHVQISCHNVIIIQNSAPFLILDSTTAETKEVYNHVKLLNNNFEKPADTENKRFTDAMYISRVRKTIARFTDFLCANNSNNFALRCVKILSDEAKVDIENSSFSGHTVARGKGGAVFVESKSHASLVVRNTVFERNKAETGGGGIYLNTAKGNLRLNFTSVSFSNCEAVIDGSAILVGKTHFLRAKPILYTLFAYFRNVRAQNCVSRNSTVCLMLKSGQVTFEQFHWINSKPNITAGGIYVATTGGKADVKIAGASFIDSCHNGSILVRIEALKKHKGGVVVANTSMFNNRDSALVISPRYKISLFNVTFSSCKHGLVLSKRWLTHDQTPLNPVKILIDKCTFKHNIYDVSITLREPRSISLTIKNSIFSGRPKARINNAYAIRFYVPALKKLKSSRATIELDRVILNSRPASSFALYFQGKKSLTVRRSIFRRCTSLRREQWKYGDSKSIYETATGAISILSVIDKRWKPGCVQRNVYNNTHPLWRYDSHMTFQDTLFQENAGLIAGAVYVSNGNTTFRNCSFQNNFAARKTGQVYSAYGTGRVEFNNCSFSSDKKDIAIKGRKFSKVAFFYSESEGPIIFRNTSAVFSARIAERLSHSVLEISNGGFVDIDRNTTIQCKGSQLSLENATHFVYTEKHKRKRYCLVNVTVLKFSCRLCSDGYYSLQIGISRGLSVDNSFKCQPCPLGATCIRKDLNIAARENFWGYQVPGKHPPLLKFIPCPKNYCKSPSPQSVVSAFNRCHGNRSGFLCGTCAPGYTETLLSSECRKTTRCSDYLLWIVMIFFSFGLALYLLTKPPLLRFLSAEQILWFMKKRENRPREQLDSGYLKIAFYYYQVADLLLENSLEDSLPKLPFIYAVISAFSFHAIYRGIACPFPGLTAVTKKLFFSLSVFATMATVPLIYCLHVIVNLVRKKAGKPSVRHYTAVVLEILLLGYDRLAETSLGLMHCVTIGSQRRLFIDGNTTCWQTWQYILLAYIVVFVVPFIAVLYYGSSKLYESSISAREFLAACVIPLPFLIYWLLKRVFTRRRGGREEERQQQYKEEEQQKQQQQQQQQQQAVTRQSDNAEVMKVLHEPFRAPIGQDQGTLYWESVLIGRRLVLLTFHSFIPNAMLRFFFMACTCDLMAIHHIIKRPFRNTTANKVEALSLITLAIIAKVSLIKASLLSSGISPAGQNKLHIEGLQWFELAAMGFVPALMSLLAVLGLLSQIVRLIIYLGKKIIKCRRIDGAIYPSLEDLTETLLNNQGLDFVQRS